MRNSWRNFFDIWAILFLNLKINQNVFQREKWHCNTDHPKFARGEAIWSIASWQRRDYIVVALIRLLFAARIHTTPKIYMQNWTNRDSISCAWHK